MVLPEYNDLGPAGFLKHPRVNNRQRTWTPGGHEGTQRLVSSTGGMLSIPHCEWMNILFPRPPCCSRAIRS